MVATYTWVGPSSGGDWSTVADWSPKGPPKNGAAVTINGGTIDFTGVDLVRGLSLDGDLLVGRFDSGSLTVVDGTITGDLQARSQGEITLKGQIDGGGEIEVSSDQNATSNVTLDGGSINGLSIDVQSDTGLTIADNVSQRLLQCSLDDMQSPLTIGHNATLKLIDTTVSSEGFAGPINFTIDGSLVVNRVANIANTLIGGFDSGSNSIDLRNVTFANLSSESLKKSSSDAVLKLNWGNKSVSLDLIGQFAASFTTSSPPPGYEGFVLSSDNFGPQPGTTITYVHNV